MEKDDQFYGFMHPSLNPSKLKSVRRCARCGTVEERDNMTEDAMITGVSECRICGISGPLNVVVVEA